MAAGRSYIGATYEQDPFYKKKEDKLIKSMTWPPEYSQKVDIKKVNMKLINKWISKRTTQILEIEDEILANLITAFLENTENALDPKKLELSIHGFLEENTRGFVLELWRLLISANKDPNGIPSALFEESLELLVEEGKEENKRESGKRPQKKWRERSRERGRYRDDYRHRERHRDSHRHKSDSSSSEKTWSKSSSSSSERERRHRKYHR
ncbi:unnamed protein product [Blepharisma stoltei]|uniref:PWI domain-containing protein n=1 Tax=Blepharisma stoltei TaxID=1481888 RepID=A0AAU9JVX9_9CILI|nr:unnamed protein product [Blepharisma stoltei]